MTTPLSFTVTVTGCKNCPHKDYDSDYKIWFCTALQNPHEHSQFTLYQENKDQLTNTCPMTKESETK